MKSLLVLVLVLSFSATLSFAADSSNENSNYLTTQGYIEYLELQIEEGDSNASEVLEQFMNLDSTKQEAFVKFLASSEYVESFQTAATTNNGEIEENYVVDGVTVTADQMGRRGEEEIVKLLPHLADKSSIQGVATAYVCRDFACREPITNLEAVKELLASKP